MMEIPVRPRVNGMNLTPLIDIVFLLLVFFLLTTHFLEEDGIGVRLPEAAGWAERLPQEVVVSLTRDGFAHLGGRRLGLDELGEALHGEIQGRDVTVVVRGDREVTLQAAVSVLDAAKQAGAGRVVVATLEGDPPPANP